MRLTPLQHKAMIRKRQSERMRRLAKQDNKKVGDYSGMKSSIRSEDGLRKV